MKTIRGFSLIELMVTLTIAGILLTVAVPGMRSMIEDSRLITQTNNMVGMFSLARSKAVNLGGGNVVAVCPGTVSGTTVTCGTDWMSGWVVFSATYNSSSCYSGTKTVIRTYPALPTGNSLNVVATATSIVFLSDGLLCAPTTSSTYCFSDSRGISDARAVSLSLTGSAKASTTAGELADGTTITSC